MPHNGMFVADLVSKGLFRNFYEKPQAELMLVTLSCSPWFQKRLVVSARREKATQISIQLTESKYCGGNA
ncbi:hypothetical protein CsSME_00048816 [Camellia sinensis var. sinensis]